MLLKLNKVMAVLLLVHDSETRTLRADQIRTERGQMRLLGGITGYIFLR